MERPGVSRRQVLGGLTAASALALAGVTYDIDIAKPVNSRISNVAYNGTAVADGQKFVVAVNNYRQSRGGGFPHIAAAPVV